MKTRVLIDPARVAGFLFFAVSDLAVGSPSDGSAPREQPSGRYRLNGGFGGWNSPALEGTRCPALTSAVVSVMPSAQRRDEIN